MVQQLQEERHGIFQFHLERMTVGRADADFIKVGDLALVEFFRVFDVKQHVGVLAAQGRQHSLRHLAPWHLRQRPEERTE